MSIFIYVGDTDEAARKIDVGVMGWPYESPMWKGRSSVETQTVLEIQ